MTTSDWIAFSGVIVALISAGFAVWSLWFTHKQWQKIKSKVAMISHSGKALEILPAWYTARMMNDNWLFGLLTSDGRIVVIKQITAISDDGKWMDVQLAETDKVEGIKFGAGTFICAVAADRVRASLQIAHIVAALDLQTS